MTWSKPIINGPTPLPRSLHSATLINSRMFVFGGWVPLVMDDVATHEKEWKCTNNLASLNLESMTWETPSMEVFEDAIPRARAGHCAVAIHSRLWIWSGRDGYRKAWNNQESVDPKIVYIALSLIFWEVSHKISAGNDQMNSPQVCCKDLWYLETERPPAPGRVQLVRASTHSLEVCWGSVPTADAYVLQVQKYDMPPGSTTTANAQPTPTITPSPAMPPQLAMPSLPTQPLVQLPTQPTTVPMTAPPLPLPKQTPPIIRTAVTPTVTGPRQTGGNVVRVRAPAPVQPSPAGQPFKVVGAAPGAQTTLLNAPVGTTASAAGMSGIAALAAAAASKERITTIQGSPVVSSAAGQTIKVTEAALLLPLLRTLLSPPSIIFRLYSKAGIWSRRKA